LALEFAASSVTQRELDCVSEFSRKTEPVGDFNMYILYHSLKVQISTHTHTETFGEEVDAAVFFIFWWHWV
jgi:hypothetical protein